MSRIQSIKLELKDVVLQETYSCYILGTKLGRLVYDVLWYPPEGGEEKGTLTAAEYVPLEIEIYDPPKYIKMSLENKTFKQAWNKVNLYVKRMESFGRPSAPPSTPTDSTKYCEWARGCRTHHPAMLEVVTKYFAHNNATLILPGNWIDKKLTEAYNSRRVKDSPEDTEEDEQTSTG